MSGDSFGHLLRELRTARGMSLAGLAVAVHYSKGQLSKIENGVAGGNLRLAHLCDVVLETGGLLAQKYAAGVASRRAPATPTPALSSSLPRDTQHFVGRTEELTRLTGALLEPAEDAAPATPRILVLHGMPGVGKTALAIRVAHRVASRFRDGCLFIDLHGHTPGVPTVPATEALQRCLRQLGLPAEHIPPHVEDRSALLRDRLVGASVLLVFDNAASVAQVVPLLPTSPTSAVLVTSRNRLAALDDAEHIEVGPLAPDAGAGLFRAVARIRDDAGSAVDHIVRSCGMLPLAIRVAAARHRDHAAHPLAELADRLADQRFALAELDDGERTATAAFDASREGLPTAQRELFTALGRHPGPTFGVAAAAAMAGVDESVAAGLLDRLVDAHLVVARGGHRYHLHDLLRAYSAGIPLDTERETALLHRVLDHYVRLARTADMLISPHRYSTQGPTADSGPGDRAEAVAWMDTEQANIIAACRVAAEHEHVAHCWQLAHALRGYLFHTKDWANWAATHRIALAVARRTGDRIAQAHLLNGLGLACLEQGDVDGASILCHESLTLFRSIGDPWGTATALGNLAWVYIERGQHRDALGLHREALAHYEHSGAAVGVAVTLRGIAVARAQLGEYDEAVADLDRALRIFLRFELPLDEAMTRNCLGDVESRRGRLDAALDAYRGAAAASLLVGSTFEEARARRGMAGAVSNPATRRRYLTEALSLYSALHAREVEQIRAELGDG